MTDPFTTLQEAVTAKLRQVEFLCDVPVLNERLKDLNSEIDKALGTIASAGKAGIFAFVLTPVAKCGSCETPGQPYFDDVDVVVQVLENVLINMGAQGTQKPAPAVALAIAGALHLYYEERKFAPLKTGAIKLVAHPTLNVYNVSFKSALNAQFDPS